MVIVKVNVIFFYLKFTTLCDYYSNQTSTTSNLLNLQKNEMIKLCSLQIILWIYSADLVNPVLSRKHKADHRMLEAIHCYDPALSGHFHFSDHCFSVIWLYLFLKFSSFQVKYFIIYTYTNI